MCSKSWCEKEELMISNSDENAAQLDDGNTLRIRVIPLGASVFNGSIDPAVQQTQANSLTHVSGTSKRGKLRYPCAVMILSIIGVLVVLGGGIFLLKSPPRVIAYRTHMQNVNRSIGSNGVIYASQEVHISFPLAAPVTNVYVKPGDHVTANQSLLQLDLSQLTPLQASSPALHNGTLVAPFSGVVTAVTVQSSELARANATLVTLQSDTTVVAHVQVPLESFAHVSANQDVLVTPSAIPNLTVHGTVSSIIPKSSAATNTFEVWITIDNTAKQLLPGMSVLARLQEPLHALTVPRLAVVNPDQGAIVFFIKNGHVSLRHVQTGGYVGDLIVIEAGLSDGDEVALTGVDTLQDGQAVDVTKVQS
jgi:multidrug efflux pump subunit AcrA (membrane-fusion protein)